MRISGSEPDRGELGHLLQQAGSAYDPQAVETLIDGVLAAPDEVGTGWHVLVADPVMPALAGALEDTGGQGEGISQWPLGRRFQIAAARRAARPSA